MFCLSFVIVTVKARLSGLDDNLEQAAMDLYATESQTFWRVTFPLVLPGIVGAALLSFSLSFDDFIITNLNAGQEVTFPMFVYGANQRGVPMQVNVIGTAMFIIAIVIVLGNEIVRRRQEKALGCVEYVRHAEAAPHGQHPAVGVALPCSVRTQRWLWASVRTLRRICSISSKWLWSAMIGGESWMTGSPRSSARQ